MQTETVYASHELFSEKESATVRYEPWIVAAFLHIKQFFTWSQTQRKHF